MLPGPASGADAGSDARQRITPLWLCCSTTTPAIISPQPSMPYSSQSCIRPSSSMRISLQPDTCCLRSGRDGRRMRCRIFARCHLIKRASLSGPVSPVSRNNARPSSILIKHPGAPTDSVLLWHEHPAERPAHHWLSPCFLLATTDACHFPISSVYTCYHAASSSRRHARITEEASRWRAPVAPAG